MTDQEILNLYIQIAPFLSKVCGPGCEVVVHDITDPEHSLIAIENSLSGRVVGDPLTDLALDILTKGTYLHSPSICNYEGRSKGKDFLSSTYFIKNKERLIGLLCINKDMSSLQQANHALHLLLEQFNLTAAASDEYRENLDTPVIGLLYKRIEEVIAQKGISPSRMSRKEKVGIVRQLNDEGLLSVKGAVGEIARQLSVSIPTIYRYLNQE